MSDIALLAQGNGLFGIPIPVLAVVGVLLFASLYAMFVFVKYYKRCPSNRILVIYGKTRNSEAATCIAGGARFVTPLLQDYAWLSLKPMRIESRLRGVRTADNVSLDITGVVTVAIGTTPELMQNAAIRLLGLTAEEIIEQAEEIIVAEFSKVIALMPAEEIDGYRGTLVPAVEEALEPKLKQLGLVTINTNVTEVA